MFNEYKGKKFKSPALKIVYFYNVCDTIQKKHLFDKMHQFYFHTPKS